ncbi:MAG TPA: DUF2267 domain-containing protein [Paracoccaceae bacterium]|nr:DUF2267 domain-containing protein [Paracoccaceae bacterium]
MPDTGLDIFDKAVQKSNEWLNELGHNESIGPDHQRAYHALRAVLWTLRDRLTVEEAFHLSSQLPLLLRGMFWDGYRPGDKPEKMKTPDEFLGRVQERLAQMNGPNADQATRAVFELLVHHIPEGEMAHVRQMMPKPLESYLGQRAAH